MEKDLQINFGIDINTISQLKAIAELRNMSQSEYLGWMIRINDLCDKLNLSPLFRFNNYLKKSLTCAII